MPPRLNPLAAPSTHSTRFSLRARKAQGTSSFVLRFQSGGWDRNKGSFVPIGSHPSKRSIAKSLRSQCCKQCDRTRRRLPPPAAQFPSAQAPPPSETSREGRSEEHTSELQSP